MSLAVMGNAVLLVQIGLYMALWILSLCIVIPMSLHQDQFKGHCLLFSRGVWQKEDGQFLVDWASQAYCNYVIFVSVITFALSSFQIFRLGKLALKARDSSFFSAFMDVLLGALMAGLSLAAALFVTLGFKVWCDEITLRFEKCSDATGNDIDKKDAIDSSGFFLQMFTAQFGIWMSLTAWVGLFLFSSVKLCRYHFEENLRVSMAKERKRLINEDLMNEPPPPPPPGGSGGEQQQREESLSRVRRFKNRADLEGRFQEVTEDEIPSSQAPENEPVVIKGNQIHILEEDSSETLPDLLH
eukprot:TRINITY_DN2718_c0_g1_i1.p1 TRINITY_DN2718_c0_g1~~TRINITY_DN2718_c0_g1_i1.p1  ORF type:complete len:299 (-),score=125.81 TRINITY_DN2718_c0_g1_i1:427-1323(-)